MKKKILRLSFYYILTFILTRFIRKNKYKVCLGSSSGKSISGNSKAMFEYLKKEKSHQAYFATANKKIANGKDILYVYSWKGIVQILSCKTLVLTHGLMDIPGIYFSKRHTIIETWHGPGPTKKMGLLKKTKTLNDKVFLKLAKKYTALTAPSPLTSYLHGYQFGLDPNKCYVTGMQRTDVFFEKRRNTRSTFGLKKDETVILYAPTHRSQLKKSVEFFPFKDVDVAKLESYFEKNNIIMCLRPHPLDVDSAKKTMKRFTSKNVRLLSSKELPDIQEFLYITDIMITDYSAIFIDMLLLEKPLIFLPYDLKAYANSEGFLLDYKTMYSPGPTPNTQKEFIQAIEDIRSKKDPYKQKREFLRDVYFTYKDGNSCTRTLELIRKLNNTKR